MYSRSSIYLVIIFAFFSSILLSSHYVSKYDHLKVNADGSKSHRMLKLAISNSWSEADSILKDIKSGKKYFESGQKQYDEFLPQKLLVLYYYVAGYEISDSNMDFKTDNGKLTYLIIKTLLYYLSLYYLLKKILVIFPAKNCFFIILFLAFEPTIFQYHSSFWNESLFLPFQIFFLALLLTQSEKILNNFFIGFILGIMFTISQEIFLYIIPLLLYYFLFYKKKSIKPVLSVTIGYLLVLGIIGFHNYKKIGEPIIMPGGSKTALYVYFAPEILAAKNNLSATQARKLMKEKTKTWIEKKNINVTIHEDGSYELIGGSTKDRNKYYNYLQKESLNIILKNPIISFKYFFKQSLHTVTLDPVYINYLYQFDARGKNKYYGSETHKKWIPIRIGYSLIIYLIIFFGVIYSWRSTNKGIIFLLVLSASYSLATLGWMGIPRYFLPSLIFLSIFFGNGMATILNVNRLNNLK
tara:strand:+ start:921 stop:2324 length:1404 start_codon:yes stop_codon:yes gene_type:complete